MLAARDQENLAHGHHTAAALKPLNQGTKQLAPKTPGNKAPKTPFKLPLNDENGPAGFGAGKGVLGVNAKGNDGLMTGGKKGGARDRNAFVTPMGMAHRSDVIDHLRLTGLSRPSQSSSSRVENYKCQSQSFSDSGSSRHGRCP